MFPNRPFRKSGSILVLFRMFEYDIMCAMVYRTKHWMLMLGMLLMNMMRNKTHRIDFATFKAKIRHLRFLVYCKLCNFHHMLSIQAKPPDWVSLMRETRIKLLQFIDTGDC